MKAIVPSPHEYAARYYFAQHDLNPFFAADSTVKKSGGSTGFVDFETQGERWQARLRYESSNLLPPSGNVTPGGTTFSLENIREYRLKIRRHPSEDGAIGYGAEKPRQQIDAHIAPRWVGQKGEKSDGTETTVWKRNPETKRVGDGTAVRVQGSNIDYARYLSLLERGAEAVGIAGYYFSRPDDALSKTQDAAMYVRVHTDESGPLHAREGPIARMGHLLENDRSGSRNLEQTDDDERGRNLPGYRHKCILGEGRIREAWPHHQVPKEHKHYYAREALSFDKDHPLRHPKYEVAYQVARWDGSVGVRDDDLEELEEELVEELRAVLLEAGIDLAPEHGTGPYVKDGYFKADVDDEADEPVTVDLAEIESQQEHVVVNYLSRSGGLSPVEEESLETLLTDGGVVSPADIADEHGRHVDSVRRALRRMEDELVDRGYGEVAIRSTYVARLVSDALNDAWDALERVSNATGEAVRASEKGLDDTTSSFIAWCETHGVDWRDPKDAKLKFRMGVVDDLANVTETLREGLTLWEETRGDKSRFLNANVEFRKRGRRYVTPVGDVFR